MWKHDNSDENQQLQEPGIEPTHGKSNEKPTIKFRSTQAKYRTHAGQDKVRSSKKQLEIRKMRKPGFELRYARSKKRSIGILKHTHARIEPAP